MSASSGVRVQRMHIECLVPRDATDPHSLQKQLHRLARAQLSEVLEECLKPLDAGDDTLVLIRQLTLDLDIESTLGEAEIARLWARQLKRELLSRLARGANHNDNGGIAVFPSPTHYLASALLDMARGRARGLWYYRGFDGLWALATEAAMRTALLDEPQQGRAALQHLRQRELEELCRVLGNTEATRVLKGLFGLAPTAGISACGARCFVATVGPKDQQPTGLGVEQQALWYTTRALGLASHQDAAETAACAQAFSLLSQLKQRGAKDFEAVLQALHDGRLADTGQCLPANEIAAIAPLTGLDSQSLSLLADPLLSPAGESTSPSAREYVDSQPRFSLFGNALLLLPQINRLPLPALPAPDDDAFTAIDGLRWLLLCVCQGRHKLGQALGDPLLRDLCGISPKLRQAQLLPYLASVCDRDYSKAVFEVLSHQALQDGRGIHCIRWQTPAAELQVFAEQRSGAWVELAIDAPELALDAIPLCEDKTRAELAAKDFEFIAFEPGDIGSLDIGANDSSGDGSQLRVLLLTLAQHSLKSFAYRLPGFADSSLEYLANNFLGMSATLVGGEQQIIAHLSRVPMSVMLNMTGINRDRIELPRFDSRPIQLAEGS